MEAQGRRREQDPGWPPSPREWALGVGAGILRGTRPSRQSRLPSCAEAGCLATASPCHHQPRSPAGSGRSRATREPGQPGWGFLGEASPDLRSFCWVTSSSGGGAPAGDESWTEALLWHWGQGELPCDLHPSRARPLSSGLEGPGRPCRGQGGEQGSSVWWEGGLAGRWHGSHSGDLPRGSQVPGGRGRHRGGQSGQGSS